MPRYKIIVEYDGTELVGWQKQPGQRSVQGVLEEAIFKLTQEAVTLTASGRTDAGVHSYGQAVSFDLVKEFDTHSLRQGINFYMVEQPVSVLEAEKVVDDFSARFSARKRYYRYVILNRPSPTVIDRNRAWHIINPLNIDAMRQGAKHLEGKHDFSSFRASECQSKNPVKTLDPIHISEHYFEFGNYIYIDVSALSFLHHMVRNITGTLVNVGMGKTAPDDIKSILEAKDRKAAGPTAPACGLYFIGVDY